MALTRIVENYQLVADIPERTHFFGGSAAVKEILLQVFPAEPVRPRTVLDIGFGRGLLGEFVREQPALAHWVVDGIDGFYDTCCNRPLFERGLYRNVWHGLAQDLGAEDLAAYDLICLLDVIEHLDADTARTLLHTLLSSLGPDARLYVSTPLFFYQQAHVQEGDLEEHLIGVPAASMLGLRPHQFVINRDGLCGNFIFSRASLPWLHLFQPTTDTGFGPEQGVAECLRLNMPIDDGSKTIYGINWDA